MDALRECAALNIQLLRIIPGAQQLGTDRILDKGEEAEFRKNLKKMLS